MHRLTITLDKPLGTRKRLSDHPGKPPARNPEHPEITLRSDAGIPLACREEATDIRIQAGESRLYPGGVRVLRIEIPELLHRELTLSVKIGELKGRVEGSRRGRSAPQIQVFIHADRAVEVHVGP